MTPDPRLRVASQDTPQAIDRHSHAERLTHWAVAVAYVALFVSGLALFHPFFFWLSAIFGGAAFMRVLHPFLGVAFTILFYVYALRLVRDNLFVASDREWFRKMFGYMNKKAAVPVEGKYNAGQKAMYWSMIVVIAALLITGILVWRPYFAPGVPLPLRRLSSVVHALMAFVMFVGIGVHVYAAYWTKGAMRAMTRGTVSDKWARHHHPGWHAKVVRKEGS
ncbi:MAG TPA: formate dehydrogenase subunit gamma [Anaeromyxobacter sp.]|nr:formate dehydrogenase subunit gamma [Anaeromyxobacter sp.]